MHLCAKQLDRSLYLTPERTYAFFRGFWSKKHTNTEYCTRPSVELIDSQMRIVYLHTFEINWKQQK